MSEWQPIETYDKLKIKPKAIFVVASVNSNGRNFLPQAIVLERKYGYRITTHWMPLPDPPKDQE